MGSVVKLFGKQVCHKNIHVHVIYFCIVEIMHYQILVQLISSKSKLS